ncbi:MAG: xanthine dehydrogenase family protein molybdopterin-binding subunit [Candidatus Thermoplasmatota archaeon]|nr:xanthine dehydrogenase family protein molybdopterin-binding subunit [Candidatus Thermoplasmatota archaeon]MDA8144036.1 xanthine dehydrogenase family protein molybdopterin-binding subunit [Thermoplasmatales archaeon]
MKAVTEIEQRNPEQETVKKYIGSSVKRKHSYELLQGKGSYTDDVELQTKLYHVSFVRSPYAHAKILKIDSSAALRMDGVLAVFTAHDFDGINLGYWMHLPGLKEPVRRPLAVDKVMYNGEPVVAIVAEDQYIAEDAAELVEVEYEVLKPLLNPFEALEQKERKVFDDMEDNILFRDSYKSNPDLDRIIDECPVIIEETFTNGRTSVITLETRVQMASFNGDTMGVWSSTQFPHVLRTYISETLHYPENKIRVYALDVGGGFGPKSSVYSDEVAVYAIAFKMKIAVKWVETRTEHLLVTGHERDQIHSVRAGFEKNGKIVALYDKIVADVGAGTTFWAEVQPAMVASVSVPGPYKFSHYGFDVFGVTTNKAPWSPNIGFGRPIAALVMERIMEMAAKRIGMDPAEIRRMNLVRKQDFPYKSPARVVYDSGDYVAGLDRILELMKYNELVKLRNNSRKDGKYYGIGLSVYSEYTAPSSWRLQKILGWDVGGYEKATIRLTPSGKINIYLGVKDSGQGHETVFAQVAADNLGMNIDDIYVNEGDTDRDPYGFGSWASRSTVTAGNAVLLAASKLKKRIIKIGAYLIGSDEEHVDIKNGVVYDQFDPEKKIGVEEIAMVAYRKSSSLPKGEEPELEASAVYEPPTDTTIVSYAWHGVFLEADIETGQMKLLKYFVVDDAGVIINPASAEGQIHGSTIAHGMQQTFEELKYNEDGVLLTTSFWDYVPISAKDVPDTFTIDTLESPSDTPGGYKGMGEGGAIGFPPVLANAISDALSPFGVEVKKIPLLWEDVWKLYIEGRSKVK